MLIADGISPRRAAAALALLGVLVAQGAQGAQAEPLPGDRFGGAAKMSTFERIFVDRVERGELTAPATVSVPGLSANPAGPGEEGLADCFTAGSDPGTGPVFTDRVRDATLMLMATYRVIEGDEPGRSAAFFGTGTIIRAEGGVNRVLTAAHVVSPEMRTSGGVLMNLQEVYAFGADGRLLARVAPLYAPSGVLDVGRVSEDLIHDDVSVLAPVAFPSPELSASWQERGLTIASEQSRNLLFFYGEAGASVLAPGHSGASLLNGAGEVVGVVTETAHLPQTVRPAPNTPMPEVTLDQDLFLMGPEAARILREEVAHAASGTYVDAVAAGLPVSDPDLLRALGLDPDQVRTRQSLTDRSLFTAGFPEHECRASRVTLEPVTDAPYRASPGSHASINTPDPIIYTDQPGRLLTMGPDGQILAPTAGGFGLAAFLSTIDAMTRSVPPDLTVTDPFATPAPAPELEGPR
ncbi:MAG: trypsin-like peptidase domain-containing protein [Myxococcales bacterium]|nr:trypsin-like peptidase domain-containing protein [Myxococcales bacterium]